MKKILFFVLLFTCFYAVSGAQSEKELFDEGVLFFKQGHLPQAIDSFSKLIKIAPDNADAYKNRGVTYMKQEKFDLAISDFEKAKALFPELKGLYSNLGVAWYYKKEYEKAIDSYNMEIEMAPENHVAYFNRALCLTELDRNQEALDDLAKTLKLKPEFYWAICYKADILAHEGEHLLAIQTYEEAIRQDPNDTYAVDKLAQLRQKTKKQENIALPADTTSDKDRPTAISGTSQTNLPGRQTNTMNNDHQGDTGIIVKNTHEIQVGAFLSPDNASRMKKKLLKNGFDSRILVLEDSKNRTWYLVRSGSYPSKKTARKALPELNQKLKVKSMVRPYGTW